MKALNDSSVVSKERPWTNNSSLPSCSSETAAGVSSAAIDAFLDDFLDFGFSSSLLSLSEESFLAVEFFLEVFFGAGFSESLESESLDESFLAGAFLAAAFFGAGFSSLESESLEESWTFFFFWGTAAFSDVFLAFPEFLDAAETFEAALGLLVATTLTGSSDELSLSLLEETTFFFFSSTFFDLFLSSC